MRAELKLLKTLFRDWYGSLSIEEIVSNKPLIDEINAVEKIFLNQKEYQL